MKTKIVYAYDAATGAFLHAITLDESYLSPLEDDVWLIPGGCMLVKPPKVKASQYARAVDGAWVAVDIPKPAIEAPAEAVKAPETASAPEPIEIPVPTDAQRATALEVELDLSIDRTARLYGYGNIDKAVSYAEEPAVLRYMLEGRALRAWRSLILAAFYRLMAQVANGEAEEPTVENLMQTLALLPDMASVSAALLAAEAPVAVEPVGVVIAG